MYAVVHDDDDKSIDGKQTPIISYTQFVRRFSAAGPITRTRAYDIPQRKKKKKRNLCVPDGADTTFQRSSLRYTTKSRRRRRRRGNLVQLALGVGGKRENYYYFRYRNVPSNRVQYPAGRSLHCCVCTLQFPSARCDLIQYKKKKNTCFH